MTTAPKSTPVRDAPAGPAVLPPVYQRNRPHSGSGAPDPVENRDKNEQPPPHRPPAATDREIPG